MTTIYTPAAEAGWTYATNVTLVVFTCGDCGVPYGLPRDYVERRREDGRSYYCPNGHSLSYHQTKADKLQCELEQERNRRARAQARADREQARADHTEQRRVAQKAATTRARKRHAAGVCPACQRTFQNVQRHMVTQHPDYDPAVGHQEGS